MNVLSYIVGLIVLAGLGYFIYRRMTKPTGSSGGTSTGGRDGGPWKDPTRPL